MRLPASHLMVTLLLASALTAGGLPSPASATGCSLGGAGTSEEDPYLVTSDGDLAQVGTDCSLSSHYRQTANITLTGPWTPIGTFGSPFTGSYDGNGKTISGMSITGGGILGMFGELDGATVNDLTLIGTVVSSGGEIGMLAGRAFTSIIADVTVSASVSSSASFGYVGGLIGYAEDTTVSTSSVAGSVSATSAEEVGGLIGSATGSISLTDSSNDATVAGEYQVGGFIGSHYGDAVTIENGTNSANITAGDDGSDSDVGGFIGYYQSDYALTISDSTNSGAVLGSGNHAGGLVGQTYDSGDVVVTDSTNVGNVKGGDYVGGLVGYVYYYSYITGSTNVGNVEGGDYVGGLVGRTSDDIFITSSANSGVITGETGVGGLIGEAGSDADVEVTDSSNSGDVSGTGTSNTRVGGLIGRVRRDLALNRSSSTGTISGPSQIGGLIGSISSGKVVTISSSFARGSVTATAATTASVGGLVGTATDFTIENSYSAGVVTATGSRAGGLVGDATNPTLTNAYSSASVTAGSSADPLTGQVVGTPTVTATFWNAADSGLPSSVVGTDVDLTDLASFTGWNIVEGWVEYVDPTSIWGLCSGVNSGRPFLLWEYETDPCSSSSGGSVQPESVVPPPTSPVNLVGEADHDDVTGAVAVSRLLDNALVVFLVARNAPADAVVAAAYGGGSGGPVLLTDADQVPQSTLDEIQRLGATKIIVIGGTERVSNRVTTQLGELRPDVTVERIAGDDRIGTAVEASRRRFPTGTTTVYVAATDAPADALIAAAQAAPVLFTLRATVPPATLAELERLSPDRIVIVGGPVRVEQEVIAALIAAFPGAEVSRSGGADRYETAALFTTSSQRQVLLVDGGSDRVDSIAAAATAALRQTAMLFTGRSCAPLATYQLLEGRRVLTLGALGTQSCR